MPRLYPLFSGSSGNCYYIGSESEGILIDAGRSAKQITGALRDNGLDISAVRAIFVTHEHGDHVSGLRVLSGRHNVKVFASKGTIDSMYKTGQIDSSVSISPIDTAGTEEGGFRISCFHTSHDCAEGIGYVVETSDGRKTAFATDTGIVTGEMMSAVKGCDTVVLESNHDVGMLTNGGYPYPLKLRILSELGHLSNETCAKAGAEFIKSGSTRIVLAHLSQRNNIPILAEQASVCTFTENKMKRVIDYKLYVADVKGSRPIIY